MKRIIGLVLIVGACVSYTFAATWTAKNTVVTTKAGATTFSTDIYKDAVMVERYTGPTLDNPSLVESTIRARLATWYNSDTFDITKIGTITFVPPAAVTPPTQADLDRIQFAKDVNIYQGMLNAVKLGINAANDKAVTDQAAKLKTNFLPEYYPILAVLRY